MEVVKNHPSVISVSTHPINHYYFIPTVYITRCVLACLVEVLTTRLSRIIQSVHGGGLKVKLCLWCVHDGGGIFTHPSDYRF